MRLDIKYVSFVIAGIVKLYPKKSCVFKHKVKCRLKKRLMKPEAKYRNSLFVWNIIQ